jgi:hypothetical protein
LKAGAKRRVAHRHPLPNAANAIRRTTKRQFPDDILAVLRKAKSLRIRAGIGDHRLIGIWFVMVKERVFVRSWSVKPNGWYRTFLKEPRGAIRVADHEIAVGAVRINSKRVRNEIDCAYLEKYHTKWELKYAEDLGSAKSRATTIEITPLS